MQSKKKLEILKKQHYKWIKSLGVDIDLDTGKINNAFEGYDLPDLSCRPSLPTSDKIGGSTSKRMYATQLPPGKTISVAYNKGPYMIVDAVDFKTMGRKI
jgi:hypothetical protein